MLKKEYVYENLVRTNVDFGRFLFRWMKFNIIICKVCLKFVSSPQDPLVFLSGKNTTNVVMRWTFTLESGELNSLLSLERLKSSDDSTPTPIFYYNFRTGDIFNSTLYMASKKFDDGPSSGSFNFTIKDMLNQINNKDGSLYNPISTDYQYRLTVAVNVKDVILPVTIKSTVESVVYGKPW
ncbi:hypothetical protein AC249_AIPGENE25032 [Exaiptasia diaphana]|nr:hypothetical protein AC249_AIPGENE25032 [Exaiptasia diaphana]